MPKEIIVFDDLNSAVKELKKFNKQFKPVINSKDRNQIIKTLVGSNIFRSFRNMINKPSVLYRTWADKNFDNIIKNISKINTQKEYDKYLYSITDDFIFYWKNNVVENNRIIYGPAIKMVNLLLKTIIESKEYRIENSMPFLHVPYDRYSLKPLKNIINQLTDVDYNISIPSSVTMKYVTTPQLYSVITNAVFRLSEVANMYPIVYDYWSWNDKH